ncbi:polysaccharide biosynthesis C-terminal domain-containing protein [Nocardioides sp.]|uniref:lipopolysaccharide biosynthesis protein n=1 Tax=Nocardioides sp. TaxID=35761 RepID=UPI0031FE756D|nr:polysaccharide biosynthesis protein [Nocardioides sp.]
MTSVSPPATEPDHRGNLEKFARRGTASVVGAGFSAVFGVVLVAIVTNGFSPALAGTLFAATSTFLILEAVALLGTDTGLVRCVPTLLASGRAADLRRTLVVAAIPVLGLSLGLAACLYAGASSLAPYLVGADAAPTMSVMLRALALVLPVATLHDVVLAGTRGTGSMRPTVVVENIGRFGLQAAAVLAVHLAGGGALALALAWSLPYLVGLTLGGSWLHVLVARRATASGTPTAWATVAREFWAYTAPRAIARIIQAGLKRSDIVLVAALASPADAALYTAATRFVVLGQLFIQSVQQALSPHVSSLFARGERSAANSVFQAATLWSMIAAWPLYLATAGFAPTLLGVFGDGYAAASDVVVILSLTMLLATACGPVDAVLLMAGRSWLSLRNNAVALALNVGLSVALIPGAGLRGAAIAHSVAIVVRNLLPLVQVRRQLGMWPVTRATVRVGLASSVCFGGVAIVAVAAGFPVAVDVALLGASLLVYVYGVWSWRAPLGLGAFRSALRRRPAPQTPGLAVEG